MTSVKRIFLGLVLWSSLAYGHSLSSSLPSTCAEFLVPGQKIYHLTLDVANPLSVRLVPSFDHYSGIRKMIINILTPAGLILAIQKTFERGFTSPTFINSQEFLQKLDEDCVYNFVLIGTNLLFSKADDESFFRSLVSKHSVLANLAEVQFAGKFWYNKDGLHVSNESGTYRTGAELLSGMSTYLSEALQIEVTPHRYR